MGNGGFCRHSGCSSGKTLAARHVKKGFTYSAEIYSIVKQKMSKVSKSEVCRCSISSFLIEQLWKDTRVLPRQEGDAICPVSAPGSSPGWTCLEHLPEEMSWRYPGHMPIWLQLASLDLKEQNAPLWAISGWLSSLPYLYAWTQPPYRRILVICSCRLVISVPTYPQLPRPEPYPLCHLSPFSL